MNEREFNEILNSINLKCQRCGNCCIYFDICELNKKAGERCEHLTDDNLCSIYKDRPESCRVFPVLSSRRNGLFVGVVPNLVGIMNITGCSIIEGFLQAIKAQNDKHKEIDIG